MSGRKAKEARKQAREQHPAFETAEHAPVNYADEFAGLKLIPCQRWDVVEWHPLPDGQGSPTQVHIVITPAPPLDDLRFLMRLKSKAACDAMIEALQRHRDNVWGVA